MHWFLRRIAFYLDNGWQSVDLGNRETDAQKTWSPPVKLFFRCKNAGVRIVQEGPTLVHALDAHHTHPEPFGVDDLLPYRSARAPACQCQAIHRRKVMRKARSKTKRPKLLADLER